MGKVVEKEKKKRGRPSLLDLQKRKLKEQQEQLRKAQRLPKPENHTPTRVHHQNPSSTTISPNTLRRSSGGDPYPASDNGDEEEASSVAATSVYDEPSQQQQLCGKRKRKREKELKMSNSISGNSGSNVEDGNLGSIDRRKRKIDTIGDGSGVKDVKLEEKHGRAVNQANTPQEDGDGPPTSTTPLHDKKLLLFILDRLQKKDTYGVFSEPVDAEELPDYHEVISHPMDFSTIRQKLATGAYANMEQFELAAKEITNHGVVGVRIVEAKYWFLGEAPEAVKLRKQLEYWELVISCRVGGQCVGWLKSSDVDGDAMFQAVHSPYGARPVVFKDVFLISSNAMQYNAPDTIYFRQARSIQELTKKSFEDLRQDTDSEPETKIVRRGRPPMENLKKAFRRQQHANSEASGRALAGGGENSNRDRDQRRGSNKEKYDSPNSLIRSSYDSCRVEAYSSWLVNRYDRSDKITGPASKGIPSTRGKRPIILDENRRNSYEQCHVSAGRQEPSVLTVFEWDRKVLIPVGLHTEYGYARSLSQFAGKLGSVAWKVASRKINRCLPNSVEFGPGWVGVNDAVMQRPLQQTSATTSLLAQHASPHGYLYSAGKPLKSSGNVSLNRAGGESLSEQPISYDQSKLETHPGKPSAYGIATAPVSSVIVSNCSSVPSTTRNSETGRGLQPQTTFIVSNSIIGSVRPGTPSQPHQNSVIQPCMNGINETYGSNLTVPTSKLTAAVEPIGVDLQPQ